MTHLSERKYQLRDTATTNEPDMHVCIHRSLSVSDNMTRLSERKYQSRDTATTNEPDMHVYLVL